MKFKELRESSGMNKTSFAKYFNVPYRTVQNWESGVSSCPEYLLELMEYKLINEKNKKETVMKKFEVKKNIIEVPYKNRKEIRPGVTLSEKDQNPEIIISIDSLEEARKQLEKYKSSICKMGSVFQITEYYIEENEYGEEHEWIGGGDIWNFSEMKIELENASGDAIASFDNMEDAEEAYNAYIGDDEVRLSY